MNIHDDIERLEEAVAGLAKAQTMTLTEFYQYMKDLWQQEGPGDVYTVTQDFDMGAGFRFHGEPIVTTDGVEITVDSNNREIRADITIRPPRPIEFVDVNIPF